MTIKTPIKTTAIVTGPPELIEKLKGLAAGTHHIQRNPCRKPVIRYIEEREREGDNG